MSAGDGIRLISFTFAGRAHVGVATDEGMAVSLEDLFPAAPTTMLDLISWWPVAGPALRTALRRRDAGSPLDRVTLLAPIPRPSRNVFCVGWNYADHFEEGSAFRGSAASENVPEHPTLFSKNAASVVGPDSPVIHPGPHSSEMDWEVELAVVIGTRGRDIQEERALEHVFGYTIANDVSVRDFQQSRHGGQWFKGKSFDTHCPLGPWIVTADGIPDPQSLPISARINGVRKQDSNTKYMVFTIARIIAELSIGMTLEPGDVILTGTPSGVGFARTPPEYLKPGDLMEMEIGGIGLLRNRVIQRPD